MKIIMKKSREKRERRIKTDAVDTKKSEQQKEFVNGSFISDVQKKV